MFLLFAGLNRCGGLFFTKKLKISKKVKILEKYNKKIIMQLLSLLVVAATQVVLLLNPQIESVARFELNLSAIPESKWHETTSGEIAFKTKKNLSCPLVFHYRLEFIWVISCFFEVFVEVGLLL